jgi:hypothetical protein
MKYLSRIIYSIEEQVANLRRQATQSGEGVLRLILGGRHPSHQSSIGWRGRNYRMRQFLRFTLSFP